MCVIRFHQFAHLCTCTVLTVLFACERESCPVNQSAYSFEVCTSEVLYKDKTFRQAPYWSCKCTYAGTHVGGWVEVTIWMRNVPTIESPIKFPPGVHLMTPVSTCCVCTLHFLCDLLTLSTHQQELLHHAYITVCSVQSISLACACNKLHEISGGRLYCVIVHVCGWKSVLKNSFS